MFFAYSEQKNKSSDFATPSQQASSAHTVASERRTGDANPRGATMSSGTLSPTVALVVKLVAKADETDEVSTFLADAVRLANQEQGTIAWFALRTDTTTFWIVDAFPSDRERQAHLEGPIASSLLANAERLLDGLPEILPAEVLAAKLPQ
jgi:quinol monooxygenase YgiN